MKGERTFTAENRVRKIEEKYTAVKGNRGPEIRCFAYVAGPINTAQEARNRIDPKDHLSPHERLASKFRPAHEGEA